MTCLEVEESLDDLLDGDLPSKQEKVIINHIGKCKGCETSFHNHKILIKILEILPEQSPSKEIHKSEEVNEE